MHDLNEKLHQILSEALTKAGFKAELDHSSNGQRIVALNDERHTTLLLMCEVYDHNALNRNAPITQLTEAITNPDYEWTEP